MIGVICTPSLIAFAQANASSLTVATLHLRNAHKNLLKIALEKWHFTAIKEEQFNESETIHGF